MKSAAIFLLFLVSSLYSFSQAPKFEVHILGDYGYNLGATALVDVDRDGKLDFVYGQRGTMYWMKYKSPKEWELHTAGTGARTDLGGVPHDVNGDGWIDFVVGDSWFENTGNPEKEEFILHRKNMIGSHDNVIVDIDGDGIKDVVSVSNSGEHNVTAWYKIPEDISQNWDYTRIGDGIHGGVAPYGYGDLNNNGHMDIVRGNVWFENVEGDGKTWKEHKLVPPGGNRPDRFGLAIKTWVIDMNNDGMPDIVQAEADTQNGRVFWWENKDNGAEFVFHLVSADSTGQDFHSLAIADFNNDGYPDIASGGGPLTPETRKLFIWQNVKGDGSEWEEHLILSGYEVHEFVAADVDGDGDNDIFSKPWKPGQHIYLENKLVD